MTELSRSAVERIMKKSGAGELAPMRLQHLQISWKNMPHFSPKKQKRCQTMLVERLLEVLISEWLLKCSNNGFFNPNTENWPV